MSSSSNEDRSTESGEETTSVSFSSTDSDPQQETSPDQPSTISTQQYLKNANEKKTDRTKREQNKRSNSPKELLQSPQTKTQIQTEPSLANRNYDDLFLHVAGTIGNEPARENLIAPSSQEESSVIYSMYLMDHVKNVCTVVSKSLENLSDAHKADVCINYLDGYISWLPEKYRKPFVESILETKPMPEGDGKITRAEVYLRLWRLLFQVCEHIAHCPNRLAQLFHYELACKGPLYRACLHSDSLQSTSQRFEFTKERLDFYQDGISELMDGKVNFDDIDECCKDVRLKDRSQTQSTEEGKNPQSETTEDERLPKIKFRKTFHEPEGIWSFVVAARNYFYVLQFNILVTLLAWWWSEPSDITTEIVYWVDASLVTLQVILDLISRIVVFRCWKCCGFCSLPPRLFLLLIVYLCYLGYIPALMFAPADFHWAICAGIAAIRLIYNIILFFRFPHVNKGHWSGFSGQANTKWGLALRLAAFFVLTVALLVPAQYLFIVPTLQRSAIWYFCQGFIAAQQLQCYLGSIGLWVPLLTVVLIIHFIAYNIVMALFGTIDVQAVASLGLRTAASPAFAAIRAFRILSSFISGWSSNSGNSSQSDSKEISHVGDVAAVREIWHSIIEDLREMDLINSEAAATLGSMVSINDVVLPQKAREILLFFLSSLVSIPKDQIYEFASNDKFLIHLPSLTQLIPSFGEAVIFDRAYLINTDNKKISNLEFLARKYHHEWQNFLERMKASYPNTLDRRMTAQRLLEAFLHDDGTLPAEVQEELRIWSSLRGQTLYRTLRGAATYHRALKLLYGRRPDAMTMITNKYQLILAHQQYGDPAVLRNIANDMKLVFKKLSQPVIMGLDGFGENPLDLVFDWNSKEVRRYRSELQSAQQRKNSFFDPIAAETVSRLIVDLEDLVRHAEELQLCVEAFYERRTPVVQANGPFPMASIRAGLPRPIKCALVHLLVSKWQNGDDIEFECSGPCALHAPRRGPAWLRVWDVARNREWSSSLACMTRVNKLRISKNRGYLVMRMEFENCHGSAYRQVYLVVPTHLDTASRRLDANEISQLKDDIVHEKLQKFVETNDIDSPHIANVVTLYRKLLSLQGKPCGDLATGISLGIDVYNVLPRRHALVLSVTGPVPYGEKDRIQGKSANQFNGLQFSYGLTIQTKDANQGGNLAESTKYPLILSQFVRREDGMLNKCAPAMIGFRESVFTRFHGTVARLQAYSEWAFVTIVQRVLARIGLRMHYGHPDIFSAPFIFSRSAISKANPTYNLSEDIFAGYTALLSDRQSTHTDILQDEKGRDTSLPSTSTFTAKIAQGAAAQIKTRDIFELHTRLDYVRQLMLFQSSTGFYFATTLMMLSVRMYMLGLLLFTLAGYSAMNLGNFGFIFSLPFLFQVGNFTLIPLIVESYTDGGFWALIRVAIDVPLSIIYFMFQAQTIAHHFEQSFIKGRSRYEATGRLLGISRRSLTEMYQAFGRSHIEVAIDYSFYVVAYYIVASSRSGGYVPLIAPMMAIAVFFIAPWLFQPALSFRRVREEVDEFIRWAFTTSPRDLLIIDWKRRPVLESALKRFTGNTTSKIGFPTLQSYSILNDLKSELNAHWRVDVTGFVGNLITLTMWIFVLLSIPGTMKDIAVQVNLLGFVYVINSAAYTLFIGSGVQGAARTVANLIWAVVPLTIIVLTFYLGLWSQFWFSIFGLFLHMKILTALSWSLFHIFALLMKVHTSRRWLKQLPRSKKKKLEKKEDQVKYLTKFNSDLKDALAQRLITALHVMYSLSRPFMAVGILLLVIPLHIIFNIIWLLPGLSEYILYGKRFRRSS